MKSLRPILLLAAVWVNSALGQSSLYNGWEPKLDNEPYQDLTAQVGDTITFLWPSEQTSNIFIHPTNDCTQQGRITVGYQSPTKYTFKPEDGAEGGKLIFFANDFQDWCEIYGMRLKVTVFPASDGAEIPNVNLTTEPIPTLPPVAPTLSPVDPTFAPIVPTEAPIIPTDTPTRTPSTAPVPLPTPFPTRKPSNAPTPIPTRQPSDSPTLNLNNGFERKAIRGLQITISGIDSFSDKTQEGWSGETEAFCTSYYENDFKESTFRTSIAVTNFVISSNSRRSMRGSERSLQTEDVIITYNQVVSYTNTGDADITEEYLAKSPFGTQDQINNYISALGNSNDAILEAVTDASSVTFVDDLVPTSAPVTVQPQPVIDPVKKSPLSLAAMIGIACGGGALVIIAILFWIYSRAKKSRDSSRRDSGLPALNVIDMKGDEVSTLAGPDIPGSSPLYGDRSIGTVDYDYSKAYEDRDHSISYAGGTLGSDTHDFSFPANAGATGASLGLYDDNDNGSYGDHFRNSRGKFKEEILHIFAPPGKLGVVIDTPDDGAPVVHAVKETSVVVDKVKVGDKLVAVDDEDVRTLTAIKVSKLISRKSANPSRKLTVLRKTHIG